MERKISDKQVLDIIEEFAKTSGSNLNAADLEKEFTKDEISGNSNIIVVEENEGLTKELKHAQNEIIPLLTSIHDSINNLQKNASNQQQVHELSDVIHLLKSDLDVKILSLQDKLQEIGVKSESTRFLLEDTKNILAKSKQQEAIIDQIKKDVESLSTIFKDAQSGNLADQDKKMLKEDFIKISTHYFKNLEEKIKVVEKNLGQQIESQKNDAIAHHKILMPKWLLYTIFGLIALLFVMFFYLQFKSNYYYGYYDDNAVYTTEDGTIIAEPVTTTTESTTSNPQNNSGNSNTPSNAGNRPVQRIIRAVPRGMIIKTLPKSAPIYYSKPTTPQKNQNYSSQPPSETKKSSNGNNTTPSNNKDVFFGND